MSFPPNVWNQLRNITVEELIAALEKDQWVRDKYVQGAVLVFMKGQSRVTVHFHPGKTYGAKFLKGLLADIGWSVDDMRRLKLIK